VEAGEELIFLDGGNGIVSAPAGLPGRVSVLITHTHTDHIVGLPFFPYLMENGREVTIYGGFFLGKDIQEQMDCQFSPPLWPVSLDMLPAKTEYRTITGGFDIGEVRVSLMRSSHPGGSYIYRVEHEGKSLVYATDFEHSEEKIEELARFSKGCDLLIYDGQYTTEEYGRYVGFGHSTAEVGMQVRERSGAKKLLITHHAPNRTDAELLEMERELQAKHPEDGYARMGQVVEL
jgi:phosphoribosyl 1,2-cyclic phosphodiesterase